MARKRPAHIKLKIDEKSFVLELELPISLPKRFVMIMLIALFIYFKPEFWNAVQTAVLFLK